MWERVKDGAAMRDNTVWRAKEPSPAKGYLAEYRLLKLRREALVQELDRLREATLRATSRITATRLSGTGSRGGMEDSAVRRVDGEAALAQIIAHIDECLAARLALLERLGDERHKLILTCRYIQGWNWEDIGHRLHYERSMIFKLHGEALEAFRGEMGKEGGPDTGRGGGQTGG